MKGLEETEIPAMVNFRILKEVDVLNDGCFNLYWSVTDWGTSWENIPEYLYVALKRYAEEQKNVG